jgi:putative transposase
MLLPPGSSREQLDGLTEIGTGRFRTLNILDTDVREGLTIEIETTLPAQGVIRVLEQVVSWRDPTQAGGSTS